MWTPLSAVLLLVATAESCYIAALLVERRRHRLVLEQLSVELRAVIALAESVAELGELPLEEPEPARPIGFRAAT